MLKLNLEFLEEINELSSKSDYFIKTTKKYKLKGEIITYQIWNPLCASILRIRETAKYLMEFKFRYQNDSGQAFDFYEFINCVSIIQSSVDTLFKLFDKNLCDYHFSKKCFVKGNKSRMSDQKYFRFLRSAICMHPTNTTQHNFITKHKFEVYPYVIWNEGMIEINDKYTINPDLLLFAWNCKSNCHNKEYYLYLSEFYDFINELLLSLGSLLPVINAKIEFYKNKNNCKRIKSCDCFNNYSEYYLYLRQRIKRATKNNEFADGGLLIASDIMNNNIIGTDFKEYINNKVQILINKMQSDIFSIDYNEIFTEFYLYDYLKQFKYINDALYISEKFHDYLYDEVLEEIENNNILNIPSFDCDELIKYRDNKNFACYLILKYKDVLFNDNQLSKIKTYVDLYEVIMEMIFKYQMKK